MPVHYTSKDGVGVFTFDNGRLNVMSMEMHKAFYHHFLTFQDDDDVSIGVIVGEGENFSAGDDLKEIRTEAWSLRQTRWDHLLLAARRNKPMIAAMRGYTLGSGFLYAMVLADIRIGGTSLQTGAPEIAYGFAGMGGPTRLALQIPAVHAAYLVLTGEKIDAQRALSMNLINEVVDDADVLDRSVEIAKMIAAHEREAVMLELDSLHRGTELSRADSYQYTQKQYWQTRKLMGDNPDSGTQSLEIMKRNKGETDE